MKFVWCNLKRSHINNAFAMCFVFFRWFTSSDDFVDGVFVVVIVSHIHCTLDNGHGIVYFVVFRFRKSLCVQFQSCNMHSTNRVCCCFDSDPIMGVLPSRCRNSVILEYLGWVRRKTNMCVCVCVCYVCETF